MLGKVVQGMKWVGCAAACAAVILTGTLAGCGSRDAAPTLTASPVVTSTKVVTATPASGKAIVQDAEKFRTANGYAFSYSTGAQGMCVFNDQQVTCQGTPESGVPKVQTSNYSASPDAITASTSGLTYGMFDHAQPDRLVPLRDNQKVFLGAVTCELRSSTLNCGSGNNSFTITGVARTITTKGTVQTPVTTTTTQTSTAAPTTSARHQPSAADFVACGVTHNGQNVMATKSTPCQEAIGLMEQYGTVAESQGQGASRHITFDDGWSCAQASNDEVRSTGASRICRNGDNIVAS